MSTETILIVILAAGANIGGIVSAYLSFSTRLTRIEDDIKWVIKNCRVCQHNSVNHNK